MSRVIAIATCAFALAACAPGSDLFKVVPPTMTLQFESEPQGAEVKTSSGQTCRTPCALAIPAADLSTTFTMNGYQPQTIPVKLMPPEFPLEDPNSRFVPSPVYAELVHLPPKKKPAPKKPQVAKKPPSSDDVVPSQPAPSARPSTTAPAASQPAPASPWPPAPSPVR